MRWTIKALPEEEQVRQLQEQLQIDLVLATLLVQRGINTFDEARSFFRPSLDQLHDPFLMKDMDLAVARIQLALANNERILVYGDYDVDGTTSVALMASYLQTRSTNIAT
jgi:single-stranded-DNA-specific exonuclease